MKLERNSQILGALFLALSVYVGSAACAKESNEPSAEDLKHVGKNRGLMFTPMPTLTPKVNAVVQPAKTEIKSTSSTKSLSHKTQPAQKTATISRPKSTKTAAAAKTISAVSVTTSTHPAVQHASNTQVIGSVVKAWLNKGGEAPSYKNGEKMQINVTAGQDCSIMIFDFDGRGKLTQLFPNQYQTNNNLKAGDTIAVGGDESPFEYKASVPKGLDKTDERIFVYAYPTGKDAPLSIAMNTVSDSPFRSADIDLEKYRALVNQSKTFFSREVKIVPKSGYKLVANNEEIAPNKVEIPFAIEAR
jgi:hypothetical protein